ncbi:hypothetical protein [Streptococcus loxodontisalivarius]|uniref:Uncharacterized protein n=1 Tax=Streptococcus loxodontisalivarius TaxID=1349415 RepID=A0ABS2PV19_9STRE|nr:hypothetical protein [Streptococcus loxodontisalivarius]MBM7643793.1 hypothetical protein [Streptococcus loxodontisalivarius]
MGETDGCAVYLDLKTNQALVADKSALLNTEGAKKTNRAIVPLIVLIEILPIIFGYYNITFQNKGYYSPELIPIFGFAYIFYQLSSISML